MTTITEKAYAKLNLSLDILSRRDDGYHEMRMVMQSISLADEVTITRREAGVSVSTNLKYLPCDDRNIAGRAARIFFSRTGIAGGADIVIKKRVPVCSGMAGGSSDAAAVLRGLCRLYGAPLSGDELRDMGRELGSDVPFCVEGGTVLATGRGDVLEELTPLPDCTLTICKPYFSISTPELFSRIRCERIRCRPDTDGLLAALENGDLKNIARRMYNVFEDVLPRNASDIGVIKQTLMEHDALGAIMTGTGSAVFGLFADPEYAMAARADLRETFDDCFLAFPVKKRPIDV